MPKDLYIFLSLLAALIILQLLPVPRTVFYVLFGLIVIGQVVFLYHGFTQPYRRRK